jgi:serine phosphatase RsbU (regulator of sigma subunit)
MPATGQSSGAGGQAVLPEQCPREDAGETTHEPARDTDDATATEADTTEAELAAPLNVLLIEDDPGGTVSVPRLLEQTDTGRPGERIRVRAARNLTEAERLLTQDVHCILLDLCLAEGGADELDTLRAVLRMAPTHAVLALTAEAVRVGAQDYLFRDELDGRLLARAIRYAVERKRADLAQHQLTASQLHAQENARLERGLLPTPLLEGSGLRFAARYRPGRSRALLGGDFYDAVRTKDGRVHVVIGDVCGHGPDEAALGVALRIAWRTLVFAGLTGQHLLTTLQHVLEHERRSDEIFATLCMVVLDAPTADGGPESAELYLAGHPAPLLLGPDGPPVLLPLDQAGPALGLLPCDATHSVWPALRVELSPGWRLLMYTDGLIEGKVGAGSPRLGQEGLIELVADHQAAGLTRGRLVDSAIAEVEELNGGALTDDVAVLLLERNPVPVTMG